MANPGATIAQTPAPLEVSPEGLLHAYRLDGQGGCEALTWSDLPQAGDPQRPMWIHLDRTAVRARCWLERDSGLNSFLCEALLSDESRPRCTVFPEGTLLILRGVNLNPGEDPDDMISLRLWITPTRVISLRRMKVNAIDEVRQALLGGHGPTSLGGLVVMLIEQLIDNMEPVLDELEDFMSELEDAVMEADAKLRGRISNCRRQVITLRRHIAPQRDALAHLSVEDLEWLTQQQRWHLRESIDQIIRYVENLDVLRERAAVLQDTLLNRVSEQLNRNMYLLSIVTTLFLPLSFVTGLLGINVGGIPGSNSPIAFAIVCGLILMGGGIELWLFKRFRLL